MNKKELLLFFIMSVFAGIAIGFGATASLLANNIMPGIWGKIIGATLFSLGMYCVITYEMKLFTGMVARIPTMGVKNLWQLPLCFLGNCIGIGLIALFARYSFIGETLAAQCVSLIGGKINAEGWAYKLLFSSILCGFLITFSVRSVEKAPKKGLSVTVGVLFPIVLFVFCGMDHSVANMYYLFLFGEFSWRVIGFALMGILGNLIGGIFLPLVFLLQDKISKEKNN